MVHYKQSETCGIVREMMHAHGIIIQVQDTFSLEHILESRTQPHMHSDPRQTRAFVKLRFGCWDK